MAVITDVIPYAADRVMALFVRLRRHYLGFHNARTARLERTSRAWQTLATTPLEQLRSMDPGALALVIQDADLTYPRLQQLANVTTLVSWRAATRDGSTNLDDVSAGETLAMMFLANANALHNDPTHRFDITLGDGVRLTKQQTVRLSIARTAVRGNIARRLRDIGREFESDRGTMPPVTAEEAEMDREAFLRAVPIPLPNDNSVLAIRAGHAAWVAWAQAHDPSGDISPGDREAAFNRFVEHRNTFFLHAPAEWRDAALTIEVRQRTRLYSEALQDGHRPDGWVGPLIEIHAPFDIPQDDPAVRTPDPNGAVGRMLRDPNPNPRVVDALLGRPSAALETMDVDIADAVWRATDAINSAVERGVRLGRVVVVNGIVPEHSGSPFRRVEFSPYELHQLIGALVEIDARVGISGTERTSPADLLAINAVFGTDAVAFIFSKREQQRSLRPRPPRRITYAHSGAGTQPPLPRQVGPGAQPLAAAATAVPGPGATARANHAQAPGGDAAQLGPLGRAAGQPGVSQADRDRFDAACRTIGLRYKALRGAAPQAQIAQGAAALEPIIGRRPSGGDALLVYLNAAQVIATATNRHAVRALSDEQVGAVATAQGNAEIPPGTGLPTSLARRIEGLNTPDSGLAQGGDLGQ